MKINLVSIVAIAVVGAVSIAALCNGEDGVVRDLKRLYLISARIVTGMKGAVYYQLH